MEIEKIREETFIMKTPNVMSREEIIGLLKRNSLEDNKKYSILSLLKFNIYLKPEDIHIFLRNSKDDISEKFLTIIKHIDAIPFEKTISMFQDLNSLYFVYVEKSLEMMDSKTKKTLTKKIYLHLTKNKHKKTIRKD